MPRPPRTPHAALSLPVLLLPVLLLVAAPALPARAQTEGDVPQESIFPGLEGEDLLAALRSAYAPEQTLGYGPARDSLYAWLQAERGSVEGVYTGFSVTLDPDADPSQDAFQKGINTEHTWPQSKGAGSEPQRSDLHILYPARIEVNAARSNHPYDEIPDALTDGWYRLGESQSNVPPPSVIDEYSEKDNEHPDPGYSGRFEPREGKSGDVARAALYFYAIYRAEAEAADPDFFEVQRSALLAWHAQDAVDPEEYARSEYVETLQGAANPFVLDTTLARRAFGSGDGTPPPPPPSVVAWVNELHYDNDGADASEFVEVVVQDAAALDLADLDVVLYNGADGEPYGPRLTLTEFAEGETVTTAEGDFTVFSVDEDGIQNGSPDGLALCYRGGPVENEGQAQFLSYEGTLVAQGGCAAGLTSTDIGVEEGSATPIGHSLQLTGTGTAYAAFAWAGPAESSPGRVNAGQTLGDGAAADATPPECGRIVVDRGAAPPRVTSSAADPESGIASITFTRLVNLDGFYALAGGEETGGFSEGETVAFDASATTEVSFGGALADPSERRAALVVTVENGAGLTSPCDPVIERVDATLPVAAALEGHYPNPVRASTTIAFALAEEAAVTLGVFDVLGRRVAALLGGERMAPGRYRVRWAPRGLPSGTYVYRLEAGGFTASGRMVLVR